jgi:hypothetical protein
MKRLAMLALVLAFGISCDDSPTSPSANPNVARFTAILLPTNEVPPVTNANASASGTLQLTMTVTRDAADNITGATYDFQFNVTGFSAGTRLTGAHIHAAPAGTNAGVVIGLPLAATETTLETGQAIFAKPGLSANVAANAATVARNIFDNPAGNYFNVHTTVSPGGAIRGQLAKVE